MYNKKFISLFAVLITTLVFVDSQAQIPEENVVLHLNFNNNTLIDLSSHSHAIVNNQTSFTPGVNEEGLQLDGANNYVEVPHASTLEIPSQVSISLWYLHETQESSSFYSLVEQSANEFGGHSRYGTWVFEQNKLMACVEPDVCPNGSTLCQRCVISTSNLVVGNWYHIVSTYDGGSQKIYINGTLDSEETYAQSTGISVREFPLTIGTDIFDFSPVYLKGTLDEIRLMNIALNADQVNWLFQEFTTSSIDGTLIRNELQVFPNPARETLNLQAPFDIQGYAIHDINGKLFYKGQSSSSGAIDLSGLESGIYLLSYEREDRSIGTIRFVKI